METELSEPTFDLAVNSLALVFTTFYIFGFLTTSLFLYRAAHFLHLYTLQSSCLTRYTRGRPYQAWALVVGASDGLGWHITQHLAAKGFNIVLLGRDAAALDSQVGACKRAHPEASFRPAVADSSSSHGMRATIDRIVANLTGPEDPRLGPLTLLVNCVDHGAVVEELPMALSKTAHGDVDATINRNLRFTTQLTRALLPTLQRNGPALVINVSGFAATIGVPYWSVDSGAKAYLQAWTQAMGFEMMSEGTDVEFLCVVVGPTGGAKEKSESFMKVNAEDVASAVLDRVGCGRTCVAAHWRHAVFLAVMEKVPEGVLRLFYPQAAARERYRRKRLEEDAKKGH